jgi:hypothetical protein
MRCLAKDRQQRFATVSELARALAPFGSSSSQVHVDRASRVQGVTDVTISAFSAGPLTDRSSMPAVSQPPAPSVLVVTPIQGSPLTPVAPAPRGTIDSWGRTDGPAPIVPARSRAGLFIALGFGFLALLGVAGFLGTRTSSAGAAASAGVEPKPAEHVTLVSAPTASSAAALDVRPAPVAPPSAASVAATAPPAPGLPDPETVAKPKVNQAAPRPKSAAATPTRKGSEASDLSDFGGRR